MKNTNPDESMDAEGLPALEDRPPGIDVELDQDSIMVPRDHPVAVGDDPAYALTQAEDRSVEGVAERAERENPDAGADELGVGGGVQGAHAVRVDNADGQTAVPPDPGAALGPEETAVHQRGGVDGL